MYEESKKAIHKEICECECGGKVISRFNGKSGFCEECHKFYTEIK